LVWQFARRHESGKITDQGVYPNYVDDRLESDIQWGDVDAASILNWGPERRDISDEVKVIGY